VVENGQAAENADTFIVALDEVAFSFLDEAVGLVDLAAEAQVDLPAQPVTLADGKADFLQADQVGLGINQLGHQQVATMTPAVGVVA
jgi:hypothetical protein